MTRVVLTRQQERNRPWRDRLVALGIPVLEMPLVEFQVLPAPAHAVTDGVDWILFTSPQGVRAFTAAGLDAAACQIGCLGKGTAAALAEAGLGDDLGFAGKDGAELARAFIGRVSAPATILLPGPETRMNAPLDLLGQAGFTVHNLPLYRTLPLPPTEGPGPEDIFFFCSPSAVKAYAESRQERPRGVAIGETTAEACRAHGFPVSTATHPDLESMLRAAGLETITPETEKKQ